MQGKKKKDLGSIRTSGGQGVLRINITLTGEIPEFYRELKQRGLVTSTRDFVIQMFRLFQEHLLGLDLKKNQLAQLENIQKHSDEG